MSAPSDPRSAPSPSESIADLVQRRVGRRAFLGGLAATVPGLVLSSPLPAGDPRARADAAVGSLRFDPVPPSGADTVAVPAGYRADVVIRWGDPLHQGGAAFDIARQSAKEQARRFGFNCDYAGFFPLSPRNRDAGVIGINHEYTTASEMFPDHDPEAPTREQVEIELEAHGHSIVCIRRDGAGRWRPDLGSRFNRRITGTTPIRFSGPAAGSEWLRTKADPEGMEVLGMLNNCSGGKTPWGTILSCEENIDQYFAHAGELEDEKLRRMHVERYTLNAGPSPRKWERHQERFDCRQEPHEPHRFGWVVEIDPFDPQRPPVKRTALGRFKHEAANTGLADDGRVVVYSGDDAQFEFLYKFVSAERYDPQRPGRNRDLLDEGTLHVARFEADGSGRWLPLVPQGPLAGWSQAEILVYTREAARLLGATPMDRPEDVEVNPVNQRVYVVMTNNTRREEGDGGANPRARNQHGHVVEIDENGGDLGARTFSWNPFLICGDPQRHEGTFYAGADPASVSPVSCPDNIAFDATGNLWIATDGQPGALGTNDAVHAVPVAGPERGRTRRFLTGPIGAEICGPEFTPSGDTFFVNIQHPGENGGLQQPKSRWPDGDLPRPSLVAIQRLDGGRIGS